MPKAARRKPSFKRRRHTQIYTRRSKYSVRGRAEQFGPRFGKRSEVGVVGDNGDPTWLPPTYNKPFIPRV